LLFNVKGGGERHVRLGGGMGKVLRNRRSRVFGSRSRDTKPPTPTTPPTKARKKDEVFSVESYFSEQEKAGSDA